MAGALATWFRSRWASLACLAVVAAALLLPPEGLGLPLCQFKLMTGIPCIGCGLTRSFIGMAHLDVARAGFYHPAGVLLFPLVALTAALLPLPARVRERLARWVESRPCLLNGLGWFTLALSMVYGFGRMAWLLITRQPSPW
jgi:hypothetical protein